MNFTRQAIFPLAIAAVFSSALRVNAQHFPSDSAVQALIQQRVDEGRAVGIVVGMLDADGSTHVVAAGDAGPGAQPLGPRSVFEIGSISKVFTGILLADMARRGEVALDDPVGDYLPEGVEVPVSPDGRQITLEDLSTHRSGLPRIPDNMPFGDMRNPYSDYTFEHLYAFLSSHDLRRDVGAEVEYSNLGTGLLGHALARAAGTDYETLVRQRIFEPLGMDMSTITLGGETERWMVRGHDPEGEVTSLWDIPALAGAGGIRSNMEDMLRFIAANVGPPESDLERSMRTSHEVREEMGPAGMGVGLNWITRTVGDGRIVWHNGGTGGFRTFAGFDPERGVGVVVLTNKGGDGADDIGFHLIEPSLPLTPPPGEANEVAEQGLRR